MADYNLNAEFEALRLKIESVNVQLQQTFNSSAQFTKGFAGAVDALEKQYQKLDSTIKSVNKAIGDSDGKAGGMKAYVSVVSELTNSFKSLFAEVKAVSAALTKIGSSKGGGGKGSIIPEGEVDTVRALKKELKSLEAAYQATTGKGQSGSAASKAVADLKARIDMLEKVKKKTDEINSMNQAKGTEIGAVEALKREEQVRNNINKRAKELSVIEASYKTNSARLEGIIKLEQQYGVSLTSIKAKIDALNEQKMGFTDPKQIERATAEIAKLEAEYKKLSGDTGKKPKVDISVDEALKELTLLEQKTGQTIESVRRRIALLEKKKVKIPITNVAEIQKIESEIENLNGKIRATQSETKKMGNTRGMRRFAESLRLVAVQIASVWTIARALSKVFSTIVDFQYTMTGVAAVTGAAASEMKSLKDMAIDLGGATIFTAKQFAELELSLGKLGFKTSEIISATKAISDLTAAFGGELNNNASIAGSTLRAFRLEAGNISQVTDTMAMAFSNSALDVEKFRESMKFAAPVAQKFGFSVQQTTAMLGKLADAGLYGSLAGTSLRNIMLKLADSNSELNKTMGFNIKSFDDFIGAMKTMSKAGFDLGDALDITDQRAVTAISTMMGGADAIGEFADQLDYAGGAAERMADKRMDTLKGSINRVKSAWQGMILEVLDADKGVFAGAAKGMNILAKNMKVVTKALLFFGVAYVSMTKNKIGAFFGSAIKGVKAFTKSVRTGTVSLKRLNKTAKLSNLAMLGISAGIMIGAAIIKKATERTRQLKEARKGLIESYTDEAKEVGNYAEKLRDLQGTDKETIKEREKLYKLIEEKYPGILKNLDHEEGKLIDQLDLLKEINKAYRNKILLASGQAVVGLEVSEAEEASKKVLEAERDFYNLVSSQLSKNSELANIMEAEGISLTFDSVIDNAELLAKAGGKIKRAFDDITDASTSLKWEMRTLVANLINESQIAAGQSIESFEDFFREAGSQAKASGIDSLELYTSALEKIKRRQKAITDESNPLYEQYAKEIEIIEKLIVELEKVNEITNNPVTISFDLKGWEEVLKINELEEFQFQKKLEKYAQTIQGTGMWGDELADLAAQAEAAGEVFTSFDKMAFFQNKLKPGLQGKKEWETQALKEYNDTYGQLLEKYEEAEKAYMDSDMMDSSAKSDMQFYKVRLDSLEEYKESFLKLWESLYSEKGSKAKKDKSDMQKVLKAIYEERKAYIERSYTDTKARDAMLLKLETEYQHQLSKLTIEKDGERFAFQIANFNEFINNSKKLFNDYIKENEKARDELKAVDPFGVDADDTAIEENIKKYQEMRKEWNGQQQVIKGVSDALDVYMDRMKDSAATMMDGNTTLIGDLNSQTLATKDRAEILSTIAELQSMGVNVESDFVQAIKDGNLSFAEMQKFVDDINKQIKENTELSKVAQARMDFSLQWAKIRNEAKNAYEHEMAYIESVTQSRQRGFGVTMSGFHAEMATLTRQKKSIEDEYNDLYNLIQSKKADPLIPAKDIQAMEVELAKLGYTIEGIRNQIYDTGKNKTFLDFFTWTSNQLDLDEFGNVQYDKAGNEMYQMGSLTDDQQEGIRKTAAFMKDIATQMVDAWTEAIDAVVSKYDELISASDSRIGELQNDLDREKDLLIEGYANNYDAVKKELDLEREKRAEMRKQRMHAIEEQKRAQKVQEHIELATQAANIFTTVTEIYKSFAQQLGAPGLLVATGVTAAFLAGMYSLKASVKKKYKMPTARQGATGVLTGKSHESGGETIPVEAESGERWSVFSRPATKKYGGLLEDITNKANSLTLDSMLYGDVTPAIKENNSQFINFINSAPIERQDENNKKIVSLLQQIRDKKERWVIGNILYEDNNGNITKRRINGS